MSNSLIKDIRATDPNETRSDAQLMEYVAKEHPALLAKYPDAAAEYARGQDARRPTLTQEAMRGIGRGTEGLESTAYGLGGLVAAKVGAHQTAQEFLSRAREHEAAAAKEAPTIPTMGDVHDVGDALRYTIGKAGEAAPAMGEMAVTAAAGTVAGGLMGTAAEPGGGTAVGAGGGLIAGIIEKRAIVALIKRLGTQEGEKWAAKHAGGELAKAEIEKLATGEITKSALSSTAKEWLTTTTQGVARKYGMEAANGLNFYAQSAGGMYNDLANNKNVDPDTAINTALYGGFAAAIPPMFLPSYIAGKFIPQGADEAATQYAKNKFYGYLARTAQEAAKTLPMGVAGMDMQEFATIAAEKYADPTTRDQPWDKEDWSRLKEASTSGGIMGLMGAPVSAWHGSSEKPPPTTPPAKEEVTPPVPPPAPPTAPSAPAIDPLISAKARSFWESATDQGRGQMLGQPPETPLQVTWDRLTPEQQETVTQSVMGNRPPDPPPPAPTPSVMPTETATEPAAKPPEEVAPPVVSASAAPSPPPADALPPGVSPEHVAPHIQAAESVAQAAAQPAPAVPATMPPSPEAPPAPAVIPTTHADAAVAALREDETLGGGGRSETVDTQSRSGTTPEPPESKVTPIPPAGAVPDTSAPAASPESQQAAADAALEAQLEAHQKAEAQAAELHRIQVGAFQFLGSLGEIKVGTVESKRGHGGDTGISRPFVHAVENDSVHDEDGTYNPGKYLTMGDELTADFSPSGGKTKTNTHRVTAFQAPDGSVVTLPVYKTKTSERGTTYFVGAIKAGENGQELSKLVKAGYKPLDSFYLRDDVHAKESTTARLTFPDRSTYEAALERPAREKLGAAQAVTSAIESKLQENAGRRTRGAEGEDESPVKAESAAADQATAQAEAAHDAETAHVHSIAAPSAPPSFEIEGTPVAMSAQLHKTLLDGARLEMASAEKVGNPLDLHDALLATFSRMNQSKDQVTLASLKELRNLIRNLVIEHGLDPREAARSIFEKLEEAYNDSRASERTPEPVSTGHKGGRPAIGPGPSGDDSVNRGTVRPADEALAPHGQAAPENPSGEPRSAGDAGNQVPDQPAASLRLGTAPPEFAAVSSPEFRDSYNVAAQRLSNAGIEVQQHNQIIDPLVKELVDAKGQVTKAQQGGVFNRAARTVQMVLHDVTNPSSSDFRNLIEETGHFVFSTLPEPVQASIASAVGKLTDTELGLGHYSKSDNPHIQAEERLMAAVSNRLVKDGFNPIQADTYAHHLVRFVKELYYKAAMAIQRALLGPQYDNPELVQRYFQNRLESFLAGDQERFGGFIDMFGGPKPTKQQRAMEHNGNRPLFERLGADGKPEYDFVPDDTMAATKFNLDALRFATTDPDEVRKRFADIQEQAAIFNHQIDLLQKAMDLPEVMTIAGMDRSKAKDLLMNEVGFVDPVAKKRELSTLKEADGQPVQFNQEIRLDQIRGKASQQRAVTKVAATVQRYVEKLGRIRIKASDRLAKLTARVEDVHNDFQEAKELHESYPYLANRAGKAIRGEAQRLFDSIAGASKRQGAIEQQLKALDPSANVRDYADAFKRLFAGDQLKGERLFNYMDKLANDPSIDFTQSIGQIRGAMAGKPEFEAMIQKTPESRALLSTLVAFAKTHARIMANLELRRMKDGAERAAITARLDTLKTEKQTALEKMAHVVRTAATEIRVRKAYWDKLRAVKDLSRGIGRETQRLGLVDAIEPMFHKEQARLAGKLDLSADAVFGNGMKFNVTDNPKATDAEIIRARSQDDSTPVTQKQIHLDAFGKVTNGAELEEDLRKMATFIAERDRQFAEGNEDAHSGVYQSILRQAREITAYKNFTPKISIAQKLMMELAISPVGRKVVGAFGTPAARMLERLVNEYADFRNRNHSEGERIGLKTTDLEDAVLKYFPKSISDGRNFLRENILSPSQKIMESQHDLEERYGDQTTKLHNAIFKRVEASLLKGEAVGEIVRKPGAMDAIRKLLEHKKTADQYLNDLVKSSGTGVEDPKLMTINPATGQLEVGIRSHLERGAFTFSRTMSKGFRTMVGALRLSGWTSVDGKTSLASSDFKHAAELYNKGPEGQAQLRQLVQKYSHNPEHIDAIQNAFFKELAEMDYDESFDGPKDVDGITSHPADPQNVRDAFKASGGDMVAFAEKLYDLEKGETDKGQFVEDTLGAIAGYAKQADNLLEKFEPPSTPSHMVSVRGMSANAMINARSVEHLPGTWFDYHSFDQRSMTKMLERIGSQKAFGRGQGRLGGLFDTLHGEVRAASQALNEATDAIKRTHPEYNAKQTKQALINHLGSVEQYRNITKMVQNRKFVSEAVADLSHFFRRDNSPDGTLRTMVRAAHLLGNLLVQQPGSAIIQFSKLLDMHLKYGASGSVVNATFKSGVAIGKELAASLAQSIGVQIFNDGDHHERFVRLGLSDPGAFQHYRQAFARLENEPVGAHIFRAAHHVMGIGLNAVGDQAQHTIFRPFEPFTTVATAADKAGVEGFWHLAERHAMKGIDYAKANPEALADPAFKFTTQTLGLKGAERDSFERLTHDMGRWGLDYTDAIKDHLARNDGTIFTDENYARLYSLMCSEIANEGNIATMSASAYNNSIINFATPLLGWSFRRMQQVADLRLNTEGKHTIKALGWGVAGLTVMGAGGLALSALSDEYSKRILGKERNLRPVFGEPDAHQTALAVMENLNRIGTLGFFGEFANGLLNVGEGGDNRMFSVDGRVVAVQSALAVQAAISSWVNQDFNADYTHVVRPLGSAVGGASLLQYIQIANNAFGLDNLEARTTARINARNYLTVVGREMNLDVRSPDSGFGSSTPMSPHMTHMELAAYKNNAGDFHRAYIEALAEAKALGHDDPVDYVKRSFATRNPLRTVFRVPPTQAEYHAMLNNMSESGRQDVSEAVRLFNNYSERLGLPAFDGKKEAVAKPPTMPRYSIQDYRDRSAGALAGSATFSP